MDDRPSITQVIESALKLTDAELHEVLGVLRAELKHRYKLADQIAAASLRGGYWVETVRPTEKLPAGSKGHIVEIRREYVEVHFPELGHFTVSASLLRKIDAPPGGFPKPASGA